MTKRIPCLTDPGISDEAWDGGVEITDSAGRVASVAVGVARYRSGTVPECLTGTGTVSLPGGGTGRVWQPSGGMLEVCHQRPDGVVVWAAVAKGLFVLNPTRPAPRAPAVLPQTTVRLAALVADPGWAWPS